MALRRLWALPVLGALLLAGTMTAVPPRRVFPLERAPVCPRRLAPGGDTYEIDLAAGQYLHATFEQLGTDLKVAVLGPGSRPLYSVDSINGAHGLEEIHLVSRKAGRYRFAATADQPGEYCPRLLALRLPTPAERDRAAADSDLYPDARLRPAEQEKRYRRAIPLLERTGDRWHQAAALYLLAELLADGHRCGEAIAPLLRAEPLFAAMGDPHLTLLARLRRGQCQSSQLDFDPALETFESAHALARELGDIEHQATALHEIGVLHQTRGDTWRALQSLRDAIALWQRQTGPEYREKEANTLTALGWVYSSSGDWGNALAAHRRASRLRKRYSPPDRQAVSALQIGAVLRHSNLFLAHAYMARAQRLQSGTAAAHDRAATLNGLGLVLEELGIREEAQSQFRQALDLYDAAPPDLLGQATTLNHLGANALQLGEMKAAQRFFERALELGGRTKNPTVRMQALQGLATLELRRRHLAQALKRAEDALDLGEELRTAAVRPDLQAAAVADHQDACHLILRILMEMHRQQPESGYDRLAFLSNERFRSRSLYDALRASRRGHLARDDAPARLLAEFQSRRTGIERLLRFADHPDADPAAIGRRLSDLIEHLRGLKLEIEGSRGSSSPTSSQLDWEEDLRLLGPDTLLLEYSLGEPSYLWAVSAAGLRSFVLPPAGEIEPLLRETAGKLGDWQEEPPTDESLARLSPMLLGPVADLLPGKHLLIAADGGAQYLPFGALPDPNGPRGSLRPLLAGHEIDYVPSLASVAELRERQRERAPAPLSAVIFADPVFNRRDDRLPPQAEECGLPFLKGLPNSLTEARSIVALFPPGQALMAAGPDASRDLVMSGRLAGFRVIHFAVHGTLHREFPELSSLSFSRYDRQGRCRDGELRVADLQNLNLPADLAVLSACDTALGRETPGEGLVGLPQAFLSAGVTRVVVSLWAAEDTSTAALMTQFYRHLLRERQPPGQALRAAQLAVRSHPGWKAPRYWAPFVLQGDWR